MNLKRWVKLPVRPEEARFLRRLEGREGRFSVDKLSL